MEALNWLDIVTAIAEKSPFRVPLSQTDAQALLAYLDKVKVEYEKLEAELEVLRAGKDS